MMEEFVFTMKLVFFSSIILSCGYTNGLSADNETTSNSIEPVEPSKSDIQCSLPSGKYSTSGEKRFTMGFDELDIKSFPFLASYGYLASPGYETWVHLCTASILSKRALMTAAHCLRLLKIIRLRDHNQ